MTFRNPLAAHGADPFLTWHDGWYYLSATRGSHISLCRARHLADLQDAPEEVVWQDDVPSRSVQMWAPEFYRLDAGNGPRWYLYYTASDGTDPSHRMFVCESAGDDLRGPYAFNSQLQTDPDGSQYAIDGSVLSLDNGALYLFWCGNPSPTAPPLTVSPTNGAAWADWLPLVCRAIDQLLLLVLAPPIVEAVTVIKSGKHPLLRDFRTGHLDAAAPLGLIGKEKWGRAGLFIVDP